MALLQIIPVWIREIPDNLKAQEMCNKAMCIELFSLGFVPDHLKTREMCDKAVKIDSFILWYIPDNLEMRGMCTRVFEAGLVLLEYVSDWFVTRAQIDLWHENNYWHDGDKLIKWYEGYQKRKAPKAKIKEELLSIAWHPDRVMD